MIYFDAAATSFLKPDCVKEAVYQSFSNLGNAGRGAHAPTLNASRLFYDTREKLCELFHGESPERFSFCLNATEALNAAIDGVLSPGDHVISSKSEHNSVLRPLYRKEKTGVSLDFLSLDGAGRICYEELDQLKNSRTRALIITHASNVSGNVTDLSLLSNYCKKHGLIFIVDGSQTVGSIDIDLRKIGIDILCFSGHKGLLGPQGTGGIYVREGISIPPFKVGGSGVRSFEREHPEEMPVCLEAGTQNGHGMAGLQAALSYILDRRVESIHSRETALAKRFYLGVKDVPGIKLYGDFSSWEEGWDKKAAYSSASVRDRTPVVSLNIASEDASSISDWLWEDYEICVRAGAHCAPLFHESMGTKNQGILRFSFSHLNTEEEVDIGIRAVRTIAEDIVS